MKSALTITYAFRSLRRHLRRTVLSVVGVGVGCALGLFGSSWMRGAAEMQIRAAAESGAGHLRIVPQGWLETREHTLRLADWRAAQRAAEALAGVVAIAPRARANALLAFGTRTCGVELTGVEPAVEAEANRVVRRARLEGRYLEPGDAGKAVVGKGIARRLRVGTGDQLYVTLAGRDEIRSAMLEIVGLLETGSRDLDNALCHVTWRDIERMTAYPGPAEISILLDDYRRIGAAQRQLAGGLGGAEAVVTWREVAPELAANVQGDQAFTRGLQAIIILVVALGIAGAQLTAVLERRREFAILSALGMKGGRVMGVVAVEALTVGVAGALCALALGGPAAWWLATRGVSFAALVGEEFSLGDILLDPHLYGDFGLWLVWQALAVSVAASVAASLYPAWLATRVSPARALRTL